MFKKVGSRSQLGSSKKIKGMLVEAISVIEWTNQSRHMVDSSTPVFGSKGRANASFWETSKTQDLVTMQQSFNDMNEEQERRSFLLFRQSQGQACGPVIMPMSTLR